MSAAAFDKSAWENDELERHFLADCSSTYCPWQGDDYIASSEEAETKLRMVAEHRAKRPDCKAEVIFSYEEDLVDERPS